MLKTMFLRAAVVVCLLVPVAMLAQQYDVVLEGGRVMDPETGLDGVRNVGISNRWSPAPECSLSSSMERC